MSVIVDNDSTPRFVYWKLAARTQEAMLMLNAAKIECVWDDEPAKRWKEEDSPKKSMPFGQLPVLFHNGLCIPQSGTMTRYCSALSNLLSDNIKDQVLSDMLHEHCNDIYNLFVKAKYSGDDFAQKIAWQRVKEVQLPEKLTYLSKLLAEQSLFSGNLIQAGDISVFSIINLAMNAGLTNCLKDFPNLQTHYNYISRVGNIPKYLEAGHGSYFKVPQ
tara:strand:+ start:2898 stop:3548 length:651 start_codon:yes stop_codon:yes gene_type:complete